MENVIVVQQIMGELLKALALKGRWVDGTMEVWDIIQPNKDSLSRLKRLSIRNKSWFTALDWKQRRFIDAVIVTVERIRSFLMLRVLAPLVRKLLIANVGGARGGALSLMSVEAYNVMKNVAERIVWIAEKWGNKLAQGWLQKSFIKYLLVMNLPQNVNMAAPVF